MSLPATPAVQFLLVDDREENLIALEAVLRRDGLECLLARSGREALELLLQNDIALAIVDVQMPEMDGYELAETMRASPRTAEIPIILVTAGSREAERTFRGYDTGAVDYLFKPIDPRLLENKVHTFFQLHRQKQQLRAMLELHEMFVGIVSHDLRNPLNVLATGAHLLADSTDELAKQVSQRMTAAAARMTRIIDQLYDLTQARVGGGIVIDPKRINLSELVSSIAAELEGPKARIEVVIEADTSGHWDEVRLGQVVSNLIGNAVKHGQGRVTVRLIGDGDVVRISVWNDGAVPAEIRDSLFDPFRRGKPQRDGLGLGLFIVREIVTAHGGRISVTSSEETGTSLTVELPRRAKPEPKSN